MKHRIALEIDGNEVTVTVDDATHAFALGEASRKGPAGRTVSTTKAPPAKKASSAKKATTTAAAKPATKAARKPAGKPAARRARGTAAAARSPVAAAEIRAWAVSTGDYPTLSARGPLPQSLRDAYTAAHRGR